MSLTIEFNRMYWLYYLILFVFVIVIWYSVSIKYNDVFFWFFKNAAARGGSVSEYMQRSDRFCQSAMLSQVTSIHNCSGVIVSYIYIYTYQRVLLFALKNPRVPFWQGWHSSISPISYGASIHWEIQDFKLLYETCSGLAQEGDPRFKATCQMSIRSRRCRLFLKARLKWPIWGYPESKDLSQFLGSPSEFVCSLTLGQYRHYLPATSLPRNSSATCCCSLAADIARWPLTAKATSCAVDDHAFVCICASMRSARLFDETMWMNIKLWFWRVGGLNIIEVECNFTATANW